MDWQAHYKSRIQQFCSENQKNSKDQLNDSNIIILGDSITENYKGPLKFINRGICSDHTKYVNNQGLINRLEPKYLANNLSHIFILIGINDLNDDPSKYKDYLKNILEIVEILENNYQKAKIHLISVLPVCKDYANLNQYISLYNEGLRDISIQKKCGFLESHSDFFDNQGMLKNRFTKDGVHLNRAGYRLLSTQLAQSLKPEIWPSRGLIWELFYSI